MVVAYHEMAGTAPDGTALQLVQKQVKTLRMLRRM